MQTPTPRLFTFTVITASVDFNGNLADLNGWNFDRYHANPVVFFNHRHTDPPIGKSISLVQVGNVFQAEIELAPTALGTMIADLLDKGYIRGASAGWKPTAWDLRLDSKGFPIGIHSHTQDLLELSIVGLPASAETLKQAMLAEESTQLITAGLDDLDTIFSTLPLFTERELEFVAASSHPPGDQRTILETLRSFKRGLKS